MNDYILDRMTVVRIEITVDIFPSADFYFFLGGGGGVKKKN